MFSHTLPSPFFLCKRCVLGGGGEGGKSYTQAKEKTVERGWFRITLHYQAHDATPTTD